MKPRTRQWLRTALDLIVIAAMLRAVWQAGDAREAGAWGEATYHMLVVLLGWQVLTWREGA